MVSITYVAFVCLAIPLVFLLFLLEKKARVTVGYMIIGVFVCLLAGEVNTVVYDLTNASRFYITITYSPIIEEVLKGIPVLYFALFISNKKEKLMSISMALGIGFAIFENIVIIVQNVSDLSVEFALIRGFASALVHGVCTSAIGFGLSLVSKRKKLAITGTFGLLTVAVTYHAIFNALIQSDYMIVACVMPVLTYIPVVIFNLHFKKGWIKPNEKDDK